MAQYKTPGVYIVEKNAFPNSVVEVATAVPAFVGHTQIADYKGSSLTNKAMRISSMAEFEVHFGGPPAPVFTFDKVERQDDADFSGVAPLAESAAPAAGAGAEDPALRETANQARTAADEARKALDADADNAEKKARSEETEAAAVKAEAAAKDSARSGAAPAAGAEDPVLRAAADSARTAANEAKKALEADAGSADKKNQSEAAEAAAVKAETAAKGSAKAGDASDLVTVAATAADTAADLRKKADVAKAELDKASAEQKAARTTAYDAAEKAAQDAQAASDKAALAAIPAYALKLKAEKARPFVPYKLVKTGGKHLLYHSMKLFFQNGGGACYIVSVGDYKAQPEADALQAGIDVLLKEQEPTMLVIPEAVLLAKDDCYSLQAQMLMHCGYKMKSRFAILDVYNGDKELNDGPVNQFREGVGTSFLAFGAAYYPWVNTTIVAAKDLDFTYFDAENRTKLKDLLSNDLASVLYADTSKSPAARIKATQVGKTLDAVVRDWKTVEDGAERLHQIATVHNTLVAISPLYSRILLAVQRNLNLLPPSAAMAGLYTMVDNTRGVWKAPANVSLAAVTSPSVNITHDDQEDLNVSTTGKSINAIRTFIGEGTLVWGARTLDGNSLDWRYINVRRTMIMLEESLRLASKAYVFEPNVANTWVTIKSMARNFLTGIWKRGGLAGASPDDAFSVSVGLNETMTAEDILEGILRVTILVAVSRPAEFIEITFQQQMQKS
ncbi:phage tail sheath family protein [Massilia pseudoviolaceinigra]|uniref:phage tail sheath family protein n=1 Tax=Massilia pseudoviolaceinigra TaxID=3057165 RepID=UPI0027967C27|nr:phage tail sheath C-terminal domain-containing protein [Massilia sp. CCM 9206]MDQ1919358.1 phage tail sheath C-terminal domain-containing protein [Massilia sp. CCM 9206]